MGDSDQKGEDGGEATEETLKKLQEQYLRNLKLQGVEGIRLHPAGAQGEGLLRMRVS